MQFGGEQSTDFREAERRFEELRRQRDTGAISEGDFDAELQELMVRDDDGRWWTKDRNTSDWVYHDGTRWVPGTPSDSGVSPDPVPGPGPSSGGSPAGLGWIIGGAISAFVALLLIPILFGPLAIFFGYMAMRAGNRTGGIAVMVAGGVCMVIGMIIGVIIFSTL